MHNANHIYDCHGTKQHPSKYKSPISRCSMSANEQHTDQFKIKLELDSMMSSSRMDLEKEWMSL